MLNVPSFFARSMYVKVKVDSLEALPFIHCVLWDWEVLGPIKTSKFGISCTRSSLPSALTVNVNRNCSPFATASGAVALKTTSAAIATEVIIIAANNIAHILESKNSLPFFDKQVNTFLKPNESLLINWLPLLFGLALLLLLHLRFLDLFLRFLFVL